MMMMMMMIVIVFIAKYRLGEAKLFSLGVKFGQLRNGSFFSTILKFLS